MNKEEEIKKRIAEILRVDIHYSPQVETYVIHGAIENIYKLMEEYVAQKHSVQTIGEYQLCPKCLGDGNLMRYNSPSYMSTNVSPVCDVCHGTKILIRPIIPTISDEEITAMAVKEHPCSEAYFKGFKAAMNNK